MQRVIRYGADRNPEVAMRVCALLLLLVVAGCSRALIETIPASASIRANGNVVGRGKAMIQTSREKVVLVRAEQDGFRPTCALIANRQDTKLYLVRAQVNDPPFPTDAEILQAWNTDQVNLCAAREQPSAPAEVLITTGDLNRSYEILGEVSLDTTGEGSNVMQDVVLHGAILAAVRPAPKGDAAAMLEQLKAAALAKYGAKVDAVINAKTETIGRDVYARGVAVHFSNGETTAKPAIEARSVDERLRELDRLGANGLLTPEEYRARRKMILNEL